MADEPKYDVSKSPDGKGDSRAGLDAASESLAKALRNSFRILFLVILFLLAWLVLQGWQRVNPDTRVLVLRWGKADRSRVYEEGSHWAWFEPIDEVYRFGITKRTLNVNTFWPKTTEQAKKDVIEGKKKAGEEDEPVLDAGDGYLLTGDLNVLESRWTVTYNIVDRKEEIIKYYKAFGPDVTATDANLNTLRANETADRLVKMVLESAVVSESAKFPVLEIIYSDKDTATRKRLIGNVRKAVVKTVTELDCGIKIALNDVNLQEMRPPKDVKGSFDAVRAAEQAVPKQTREAEKKRMELLVAAAGDAVAEKLGDTIESWWAAKHEGRKAEVAKHEARINSLLDEALGDVANIIRDAKAYSTQVVAEAEADAKQIRDWTAGKTAKTVRVYADVYRAEAIGHALKTAEEVLWLDMVNPNGASELEVIINRHPSVLEGKKKVVQTR